jgi:Cyclic nucleotide-binding domain
MSATRIASSVTSISWIPKQAVEGLPGLPFGLGATHYDPPPPDTIEDIETMNAAGSYRFANKLEAWIETEGGKVVDYGQSGRGYISGTEVKFGLGGIVFQPVPFPDLQWEPKQADDHVTFLQTAGGRTGMPAPRRVRGKSIFRFNAPPAWTTLSLTLHANGRVERALVGASPFPRHWVYDDDGSLVQKSGLIDFQNWYRSVFDTGTPWEEQDMEPVVMAAESNVERQLSKEIIDLDPRFERLAPGDTLIEQGDTGTDVYLLFDGVLSVEQGGEEIVELGPGAIVGEMALVDGTRRNATLRATTPCRVAVIAGDRIDRAALTKVAEQRRPKQ